MFNKNHKNYGNGHTKSLCERMRGKKGITALIDDIVEAHMHNQVIQPRFLTGKILKI